MPYDPRPALLLRLILLLPLLAVGLSACATPIVTASSASGCSTLVPDGWKAGVPGAEPPADDTVGAWISFGDQQTGALDKANGRTADTIGIVERCEARDRAAVAKVAKRKFLGVF